MPVHVEKRHGKYRIIEPGGRLARAKHGEGRPVDGGGHKSKAKAHRQASYINEAS